MFPGDDDKRQTFLTNKYIYSATFIYRKRITSCTTCDYKSRQKKLKTHTGYKNQRWYNTHADIDNFALYEKLWVYKIV